MYDLIFENVPQNGGCQELNSIYSHRQGKLTARGHSYGGRFQE